MQKHLHSAPQVLATLCQPCRVGLVSRKQWEDLTQTRAGMHWSELDAALQLTLPG
jgi:hypothetical protein